MMKPAKQWILWSFLFILLSVVTSHASPEEGWKALFANDFPRAQTVFEQAMQTESSESVLCGLVLCAWVENNPRELAKRISQLITEYPESPYVPCYLALWGDPNLQGWPPQEKISVLEQALQTNPSASRRQQLAYKLAQTLDMLIDERAEKMSREAGILLDHWNIVGPFGQFGSTDLSRPFGPETGIRSTYAGWQKEAAIREIERADKTGLIELESFLHPATGVMYALNVIESQSEGEAFLTVHSPSDFRVWWDGQPVMEKSFSFLDTARAVSVRVPLRKGKILLTLKSRRHENWWFRATLQASGDSPLSISTIPLDVNDFSHLFLLPFETCGDRTFEGKGIASDYPFDCGESKADHEMACLLLLRAFWHAERSEFDSAKELVIQASRHFPDSALILQMLGDYSLRHGNARPGSKSRFQQEAESAFTRALELAPRCKSAVVGLQSYYLDRDQVDPALKVMDDHVREFPEILSSGYGGLIQYSYGVLYSRKGFKHEAAKALEQSKQEFIPSLEVYTQLFDYYEQNNNTRKAAETITEALRFFPAYLPYLNRAARLKQRMDGIPDVLDLMQQAVAIHPNSLQYAMAYGRTLERYGEWEKARSWYQNLSEQFPDHPQPQEKIAGLAFLRSDRDVAVAAYRQLYDSMPIRMEPFRVLRDVDNQADFPYLEYDVQLDDIDISMAEKWKNSRASAIFLLDIMVLTLYNDGTFEQYIHQAIRILNEEGKRKWAEIVIPSGSNIEILAARTITPKGTEWAVSNIQNLNNRQSLSMYGIEEGAIVEYAYLERTGRWDPGANVNSGGYFFGAEDDPMVLSKLTVIRPENLPLHLDGNPDDLEAKIIHKDGNIIYVWEQWMSEGIKPERFSPPLSKRVPALQWSTCSDWLPFVEGLRATLAGYEETSDKLSQLAEEIWNAGASKQEYVQNVYDWIRTHIEESTGGITTADTVALRAGRSYHKLRLAGHLLRLKEIRTHVAQALENDENDGFRPLPYPAFPGATVLLIPKQEGIARQIVMYFSSRFAPLEPLDARLRKMTALIFDGPAPYFEPLQSDLWEHGLLSRQLRLVLQEDHGASVEGEYTYDNGYDWQIREALTNPEVRQRLADAQIVSDLSGIRVDRFSIEDVDEISLPPRLVFSGAIPDVAKPAGNDALKIVPILVRVKASELVNEVTRESSMVFQGSAAHDPLQIRIDVSTLLRQGASITLPANTLLINEYGYYSLFYGWDGTDILIHRAFLIPPQEISPSKYEGFTQFCRLIDQMEDREIVIRFARP
ncbi:MAG: DUF3857 domain-containing protein [Candidatus Omnitrophota bacterium]|jgi:tetratricopeptide (TPR) repeat protein|nr:MAG: DUF3857 domain-containing protein [Candidatus Omnitrophota bacterium]